MSFEIRKPKVLIACAWYNRAEYIRDTLDSLLSQTFDDYIITVVNDGSKDPRVKEILDSYNDPKLTVIHQENTGLVGALRRAIESADSEYIAIQGAGDVSFPERIAAQVQLLDTDSSIGVVGCKYKNIVFGGPNDGYESTPKMPKERATLESLLKIGNPFSHGDVMYRRELYQKVGGYREYFKFAQDRDLWIRMAAYCDMQVVDKLLYERRSFYSDGVSADIDKLILQKSLSNFAIQCHYNRETMGTDFVEKYGMHAGMFRKKNKPTSIFMAKKSLECLYSKDLERALYLSSLAIQESVNVTSVIARSMAKLSSMNSIFSQSIQFLLGLHSSSSKWSVRK